MKHRYALQGLKSGELLTYRGRIIVHNDPNELSWLLRGPFSVVKLPPHGELGRSVIALRDHPGCAGLTWPLNRADFKEVN